MRVPYAVVAFEPAGGYQRYAVLFYSGHVSRKKFYNSDDAKQYANSLIKVSHVREYRAPIEDHFQELVRRRMESGTQLTIIGAIEYVNDAS